MSAAAAFVARKPLTLLGRRYRAREVVDLSEVSPVLRRRLVELRRVVPRAGGPAADPAVSRTGTPTPATCGTFGGRRANGQPCKWKPWGRAATGLCSTHRLPAVEGV